MVKPGAQYAMPSLRLMTGLNVSLRILIISGCRLMASSVALAVLFKVVTEKVVILWDRDKHCCALTKMPGKNIISIGLLSRLFQDLKL